LPNGVVVDIPTLKTKLSHNLDVSNVKT